MAALEKLHSAELEMSRLEQQLVDSQAVHEALSRLVDFDQIARVERCGGQLFYRAGTLGKFHDARIKTELAVRSLAAQRSVVGRLRELAEEELQARFVTDYRELVEAIQSGISALATQFEQLGELQQSERFPAAAAEINPPDLRTNLPTPLRYVLRRVCGDENQSGSGDDARRVA